MIWVLEFLDCLTDDIEKPRVSATPPTTGVGEDAGKKEPSYTVGGNVD
jgi:hypothetical protein